MSVLKASSFDEQGMRSLIRDIADYPKPGIVFKDITPLLADAAAFSYVTNAMAAPYDGARITHVAAVESRGFIFGGPICRYIRNSYVFGESSGASITALLITSMGLPSAYFTVSRTSFCASSSEPLNAPACTQKRYQPSRVTPLLPQSTG